MPSKRASDRVQEPVQVYLDRSDRELLEEIARSLDLSKAEVLRRGLRSLAERVLAEGSPGWSFRRLVGALGDRDTLPRDLAARHDDYLYGGRRIRDR